MGKNTTYITLADFAQKYLDYFERMVAGDRVMYAFFDDRAFPDECWSLGFEMDCGQSFIKTCGEEAWRSVDALQRIIDSITNTKMIGSVIFSQWRYFNHWADCGPKNARCFSVTSHGLTQNMAPVT